MSTLHFIYDKLKSALISACRGVFNQCLEQHVYQESGERGRQGRWESRGEITKNISSASECRAQTGSVIVFLRVDAGA